MPKPTIGQLGWGQILNDLLDEKQPIATLDGAVAAKVTPGTATYDAVSTTIADRAERKTRLVVGASNSDYSTLTAALAAAVSGDEVFLRAGAYALPVTIPAGVRVLGSKAGVTLSGEFSTSVNAVTLGSGASLENVTLHNTHATGGSGTVPVGVSTNSSTDVAVRGCKFTGTWAQAILVYNGSNVSVTDCTFDATGQTGGSTPGDAINVYGADGVTVRGCLFKDLKQDAVYAGASAKNVTITGNIIRGCPEGIQVRVGCESVSIIGNSFDIKGVSGITSFGVIIQSGCFDCTVAGNSFRTTAGTGTPIAAVSIDTGCYRCVVDGNAISSGYAKGVVIQKTGAGSESFECVISNNSIESTSSYAIHVGANENRNIVVGNVITEGSDKAILFQGGNGVIGNNLVKQNAGFDGITVAGSYNSVTGNNVWNVLANAGILLSGSYNTATGNTCTTNNTYGINDTGDFNLIVGNNCDGNEHATTDIASSGANSKVGFNIGRYTAKGSA